MGRRRWRVVPALLASLLATGLLATAPVGAAPDFCRSGVVAAASLPPRVDPAVCDLAGRTVQAHGLRLQVPPPGQGRSVAGLTSRGEVSLEVTTTTAGLVEVDVEEVAAGAVDAVEGSTRAAYTAAAAAGDGFAQAAGLPIPQSYMPTVGQTFLQAPPTLQPGEPAAGCDGSAVGSLWYRIGRLGSLRRIELRADVPLAVYRGTELGALQRAACIPANQHPKLVTLAPTGAYYVQAALTAADAAAGRLGFHVWLTNAELRPDGVPPCDSRAFDLVDDITARKPLRWRFDAGSTPASVTRTQALRAVKQGMSIVTESRNDCGLADTVSARHSYLGTTTKGPTMCIRGRNDGVNAVGFAPLPTGMLGLSCSAWTISATGRRTTFESDVQLSDLVTWTLNPDAPQCNGATDLVAVAAHEIAHAFGIDHALGDKGLNQTMGTSLSACNGAARTLGRGDVLALRKLY